MIDLCPISSNCHEITVKLCWPHLEEKSVPLDNDQAVLEAASRINDYNGWCEQTRSTNGAVPMLDFFPTRQALQHCLHVAPNSSIRP